MILLLLVAAIAPLDSVYQAGEYENVVQLAPGFLADSARTAADSVFVSRIYASALVALGRTDEAAAVFRQLLIKDPSLTLDPEMVSPKIRAVFESVKAKALMPIPAPKSTPAETMYLRQPTPLSVLIPGLHQIQAGRSAAGYALAGATALSLVGLVFSHVAYNDARADYLQASSPQEISDRYRDANNWSHVRVALSGTTVTFWLTGLITALRSP
ncbi:hypothetical protein JXD38_04135 [candidate division WOR-3 bacterium]|nr:hypothetical protein [candidate division WOR-3 bacterium]